MVFERVKCFILMHIIILLVGVTVQNVRQQKIIISVVSRPT